MGRIARTANSTSRRGFVKIAIAEVGAAYLAGNTSRAWVSEENRHEETHAKIVAARGQLKAAGADTKFFVINGNHDVDDSNGLDFSSGAAVQASLPTPPRPCLR